MKEINSSREEGSSTSAGSTLLKISTLEPGAEVEGMGVDLGSGCGVTGRAVGVSNLTTGFTYGWERLRDKLSE